MVADNFKSDEKMKVNQNKCKISPQLIISLTMVYLVCTKFILQLREAVSVVW